MDPYLQQKQEKLKAIREQAKQRREQRQQRLGQLAPGLTTSNQPSVQNTINNELINQILTGVDPFATIQSDQKVATESKQPLKEDLLVSTFVVDMQIPAKEKPITYDRQVQCDLVDSSMIKQLYSIREEQEHEEQDRQNMINMGSDPVNSPFAGSSPDLLRRRRGKSSVKGVNTLGSFVAEEAPPLPETEEEKAKREKKELMESFKVMTKDDSAAEMGTRGFEEFMSRTSRIIERALGQEFDAVDVFFDEKDGEGDEAKDKKGDKLTQQFTFHQNMPLKRSVTSMDWSPKEAELMLVSYSKCSEFRYDEPDGMVNIFSLGLKNRPEYTLTCHSEVTKAIFHPYLPNIVIGATQSGYIVQWDVRVKSTPIEQSIVARDGHYHPINSLAVVGTKNAHNIVSISNDSKICQWHLGELKNPKINFVMFQRPNNSGMQANDEPMLYVNTMEFPEDESDKFYVGADDYNIYQANMHMSDSKRLNSWQVFQGHEAPVTKISMHPGKSMTDGKGSSRNLNTDMSELMLSASRDWTVKLWYAKNGEKKTPIHTFESSQEYVQDVQWSPVHPTVFAQVDADGFVDVWDINKDTESPIAHKQAFGQLGLYRDMDESKSLSCLKWSRDGRRIAIGDSNGFVTIWQTDKELYMPQQNDFDKIEELIQTNQADNEN